MADHHGSWYPLTQQGVQWDASGNPYYNTSDGLKDYIPPISAAQYQEDPRMLSWAQAHGAHIDYQPDPNNPGQTTVGPGGVTNTGVPGQGILHQRGQWNSQTGQYDTPLDWGNIASIGIGGAIAAPFVAGALAGAGAGAAAGGGGAATGVGAGAGAGAGIGLGETGAVLGTTGAGLGTGAAIGGGAAAAGTGAAVAGTGAASSGPLIGGITGATTSATVPASLAAVAPTTTGGVGGYLASQGGQQLIGTGASVVGGYLQGKAAEEQSAAQRALTQQQIQAQREDQQKQLMASYLTGQQQLSQQDRQTQAAAGLSATQMDPYTSARALNSQNVKRSLLAGTDPSTGKFNGNFDLSAISPENLQKSGDYFYSNVAAAQPNVPLTAQSSSAEQFRQQYQQKILAEQAARDKAIQDYLNGIGSPIQHPLPQVG